MQHKQVVIVIDNIEAELLPKTVKHVAEEYFATDSPAVVHGHKAKGHFPQSDYTLPARLHGREVWFAGTVAAWRRKYIALLMADDELREMSHDRDRIKEANARRHAHMRAATEYAEARGRELLRLAIAEHMEDDAGTTEA
jgi:hypothetical protein